MEPLPWWPKRPGLTFQWTLTPRGSMEERAHPRWWFLDAPEDILQSAHSMEAVLEVLRSLSQQQIARKREALLTYRHLFTFNEKPTHPMAASDVVAEMMCTYAKLGRRKRKLPHGALMALRPRVPPEF
jgi:hypothetical protein